MIYKGKIYINIVTKILQIIIFSETPENTLRILKFNRYFRINPPWSYRTRGKQ